MYNTFGIPSFIRTSRIDNIWSCFVPAISETKDKLRALLNWVRVNLRAIIEFYHLYNTTVVPE